jgi:hypothetical protein
MEETMPMPLEAKPHEGHWLIYEDDELVFSGTYRQAEDWLNRKEYCQGPSSADRSPPPSELPASDVHFWPHWTQQKPAIPVQHSNSAE